MNVLETLLNRRWILKSEEKNLYYQVRDTIGELRPFLTEKLGCHLIENSLLVKLEKIPAQPESFMGIEDFHSTEEYVFFCILLMFLEDRDAEEQFILSQLTEYIAANTPENPVDWTLYTSRRKLVRVLQYAVSQGILNVSDGSTDGFVNEYEGEVLYENTGASRYFMRSFPSDIMNFQTVDDFYGSGWYSMDEDRGLIRRHRVYNRLLFSPGMYRESGSPEDFEYLKYYHRRLREDLERYFDCQIQIYRGSAFFIPGDDCRIGHTFPENNTLSDAVLLVCSAIRERIREGIWKIGTDETVRVERMEFDALLAEVKRNHENGFVKKFRIMSDGEFAETVKKEMVRWTFLRVEEESSLITILPLAGHLRARYPADFLSNATASGDGEAHEGGSRGTSRRKKRTSPASGKSGRPQEPADAAGSRMDDMQRVHGSADNGVPQTPERDDGRSPSSDAMQLSLFGEQEGEA